MKPTRYPIPAETWRREIEIERSRFITTIAHTETAEQAQAFVASIKAEFADANHNCWAYLIGPPGSTSTIGLSDDGEPHGTAGRPMLTSLTHGEIGDITAVVTRYFGGIKLGKGGLVKAYTAAVQDGLKDLPRAERVDWAELLVIIDYSLVAGLKRLLEDFEVKILEENYEMDVEYRLQLPREQVNEFCTAVTDLSCGQALIESTE